MAKSSNQKLKILYIMKMLLEKTDEENTMTINDMIAELERYGITAERKSIYDDIDAYFGHIRTLIPVTSGRRFGIIRTAFRLIRTPCRVN
jgi:hypothetical protein